MFRFARFAQFPNKPRIRHEKVAQQHVVQAPRPERILLRVGHEKVATTALVQEWFGALLLLNTRLYSFEQHIQIHVSLKNKQPLN